jgi:hypothetical protein
MAERQSIDDAIAAATSRAREREREAQAHQRAAARQDLELQVRATTNAARACEIARRLIKTYTQMGKPPPAAMRKSPFTRQESVGWRLAPYATSVDSWDAHDIRKVRSWIGVLINGTWWEIGRGNDLVRRLPLEDPAWWRGNDIYAESLDSALGEVLVASGLGSLLH